LVWKDRSGRTLGAIGQLDSLSLGAAAFTTDERRLALWQTRQGNQDVWILDVNRGVPTRFTFGAGIEAFPVWSPDGNRVVFQSNRNGSLDLFERAANGISDEREFFASPEDKWPMDWSQDARTLLFDSFGLNTETDVWALPLDHERPSKPFALAQSRFSEGLGQFSSDGRWVAYQSNESGKFEIYVQAFPISTGKLRVSSGGGTQPRWSRDGKELFHVAADGQLMAVPMALASKGPSPQVGPPRALFPAGLSFSAGNYFVPEARMKHQYSVAADGRFLFNVAVDEPTPSITVVLNWDADLGR
jgi:Tol biopolymer transport system component